LKKAQEISSLVLPNTSVSEHILKNEKILIFKVKTKRNFMGSF